MAYRNLFRWLWWKSLFPVEEVKKDSPLCVAFGKINLRLNYFQLLTQRKRKMCRQSSRLSPLTFHPSADLMDLMKTLISPSTSLIHSFTTCPADSSVLKLTCQQFALPVQEHWVEKKGKCWLHCSRRRKHDWFLAISLPSVAFPGMPCSKKLGQPACS